MDGSFVNSLLASQNGDFDEVKVSNEPMDSSLNEKFSRQSKESFPRESIEVSCAKLQEFSKSDNGNSNTIHPIRTFEDENIESHSIASLSSFEFHKGVRATHASVTRSCSRPMSFKWNDAEKWIINKQNVQAINVNRDHRLRANQVAEATAVDLCHPDKQIQFEKFSSIPCGAQSPESDTTGLPAIRSVYMRDMGTEMTPATSQESSRTSTPVGATTPLQTPVSSASSTLRRGEPTRHTLDDPVGNPKKELSKQEMKLKTRREIVALGVQLGKMNIASWASKDKKEKNSSSLETANIEELKRNEYEKRAAAWEITENSKHTARYKREEIKIETWESQQRAKLEAEMKRIEAKVEQMRAQAQALMVKKIAMVRQIAAGKREAAEARKNQDAKRTTAQAEYILRTGRMSWTHIMCCGWL